MRSKIVLIRHGITTGNINRLYYGSTDVPLAAVGIDELRELKEEGLYPDAPHAEYYTSGMLRAEQSFEIIYGGDKGETIDSDENTTAGSRIASEAHEIIEEFRELDFGDFEMKRYEELKNEEDYIEWISGDDLSKAPPNGESVTDFRKRVLRGFNRLKARHERQVLNLSDREETALSICVCHGGVISGILSHHWPEESKNFFQWIPDPGHGYVLIVEGGEFVSYREF